MVRPMQENGSPFRAMGGKIQRPHHLPQSQRRQRKGIVQQIQGQRTTHIHIPACRWQTYHRGRRSPRSHRTNHHRTIVKISATQKRPKIARHTLHLLRSQRLFQNRQSYPPAFGHLPRGTRKEEGNMKPAFGDSLCYIFERNGNGAPNAPRHLFPPRHLPAFPPRAPSPFRPMLTRR